MPIYKVTVIKRAWLLIFLLAIRARSILPLAHDLEGSKDAAADELDYDEIGTNFASTNIDLDVGFIESVETSENDIHKTSLARGKPITAFLRKRSASSKTKEIFHKAFSKAVGGGITGAIAGIVQVLSLMWLVSESSESFLIFRL
jgi:hypothetical protein